MENKTHWQPLKYKPSRTFADVRGLLADIRESLPDIRQPLRDIRELLADIRKALPNIRQLQADIRETLPDIRELLADVRGRPKSAKKCKFLNKLHNNRLKIKVSNKGYYEE